MACGTQRSNVAFTKVLQQYLSLVESINLLVLTYFSKMYLLILFSFVIDDSICFNEVLSRSIFFRASWRSSSLEILTNLSASILVTCSFHSLFLFFTHSVLGWILQDFLICWLLILSIFVLPTISTKRVASEEWRRIHN